MKYKVILKKDGKQVGDIGDYSSMSEATKVANEFNIKYQRRAGKAHVVPMRDNPQKEEKNVPKMGGGLVLRSSSQTDDRDDLFDESSEDYSEDSISEDIGDLHEVTTSVPKDDIQEYPQFDRLKKQTISNPIQEREPYRFKSNVKKFNYRVPSQDQPSQEQPFMFAPRDISAHGVMINDDGYVLLREPKNRYLGIRWEFYGGKIESGEKLQDGLQREIKEETGYSVELVDKITNSFISGKEIRFYLVRPLKKHRIELDETQSLEWVSQDEAYDMLSQNKGQYKTVLRKILDKAFSIWKSKRI